MKAGYRLQATGYYLHLRAFSTLYRQEKSNQEFSLTGRNYLEGNMKQVDYDEGWSGPNKYTFEVYQLENGTFRVLARKWNAKHIF